ncbi:DUF2079 domain-containing protein [Streptomyces sp. BE20]|uniref:DUF2079 domain-containing protein n=1 Tax=Streptomyces sp. BE20 TaxID=3002525 RepID=UPI002E76AABF|nr:DUF2079 domain-containing protein [Streptomyces sp. BE20]MEE1823491.1 DUF2079 domain-containing protein [Streptomyces sp. BE20]
MRLSARSSAPRPAWAPAWALAGLFAVLYGCVAVNRHRRMLTQAYDLGIFEQAVRAYAHGEAPVVLLKGPGYHLLGDHFHPVLVTLAPFYRAFPGAVTLLVAQAVLMALAVVPLTCWAYEVGGRRVALTVGVLTGASWGIVNAAADDFHEIAFAVPLLAFAATALGRGRPVAAALWALPLVLVKEDLGLTVAAFGVLIFRRAPRAGGGRALGFGVALLGVAATALTVLVVLPSFNPDGGFDYWRQLGSGGTTTAPWAPVARLGWPPLKWLLLFLLAATAGFLGLRSPLALLCVPTLAWRLLADNPHYWGVGYHYSAVLMPLAVAALVDALGRAGLPGRADATAPEGARDGSGAPGAAEVPGPVEVPGGAADAAEPGRVRRVRSARRALAVGALVAAVTFPAFPLHEVVMPETWQTSPRLAQARAMLARIPDGATVAASNRLAAQLTGRATVALVCREPAPVPGVSGSGAPAPTGPQWVAVDLTDPSVQAPCAVDDTRRMLGRYEREGYRPVVDGGGLLLLKRP